MAVFKNQKIATRQQQTNDEIWHNDASWPSYLIGC